MTYTDAELEAMGSELDNGLTDSNLEGAVGTPGPRAWLLDIVDDWDALADRARAEKITPEALVRKAVEAYLRSA
jgi:hypothetical protein